MSMEQEQAGSKTSGGCRFAGEEIIPHIYGEESRNDRSRMQDHLKACPPCREEVASLRSTLELIGQADVAVGMPPAFPGLGAVDEEWARLRARIAAERPSRTLSPAAKTLLKAAGITLLVGASFLSGRLWQSPLQPIVPGEIRLPESAASNSIHAVSPESKAALLRKFAKETNGYLTRSRMVLLAFSNAGEDEASAGLTQASASLLREASRARRLAGELRDPRLQGLLVQLEHLLDEIAGLSTPDVGAGAARLRGSADLSSVLDQLEVLAGQARRREKSNA